MWTKIVQSGDNNLDVIDHKFLLSGHSFLPNDHDFGVVEMAIQKTNFLYILQNYYKLIQKCRKHNTFLVHEMKSEDFYSTKPLEEAILKRTKNTDGETVNWLNICWIRFLRNAPYKLFYKTSMEKDSQFKTLNLSPKRGRPSNFGKIVLSSLYEKTRPVTKEKYKDMMDLLPYVPLIHHEYFKNLHYLNFTI